MALCIVVLECRHYLRFDSIATAPLVGEKAYCPRCRKDIQVSDSPAGTAEYRWRCRKCKAGRRFGAARVNMEMGAARHGLSKGHDVDLILGNQILHTYRNNERQYSLTIPDQRADDPPPF